MAFADMKNDCVGSTWQGAPTICSVTGHHAGGVSGRSMRFTTS